MYIPQLSSEFTNQTCLLLFTPSYMEIIVIINLKSLPIGSKIFIYLCPIIEGNIYPKCNNMKNLSK